MSKKYTITVFTSISVDGGIGFRKRKIVLSSFNDLRRLHYLRSLVDAIVIGANTVLWDDPLLTVRIGEYIGKQPYRIVIDKKLRTNPHYRIYETSIAPTILVTSEYNRDDPRIKDFISKGVYVVYTSTLPDDTLDLRKAFNEISIKYNIKTFLVEGGGFLIGSLIRQRLVDRLIVSITPHLLGRGKIDYINIELDKIVKLKLETIHVDKELNEVILEYLPIYE